MAAALLLVLFRGNKGVGNSNPKQLNNQQRGQHRRLGNAHGARDDLVEASCVSFASVQARKLNHYAASPLPTKPSGFAGSPRRASGKRAGGSAGGTAVSQGSCRDFPYSSIPESRRCLLHGQHPFACPLTHPETPWYIFQNHVHVPPVLRHLQAQALPRIPAQAQRPFANAPLPSPDAPANFQILRSTPSLPPPLPASSILLYQVYAPRPTHTVFWNTERSPFFDTVREAEAAL